MKNRILFILLISFIFLFVYFIVMNDKYSNIIEQDFGLSFKGAYRVSQEEFWAENGDGEKIIILKFKNFNGKLEKLKPLPIKEDLPPNRIPKQFLETSKGYYMCIFDVNDERNFRIIIVDINKKEICIYYQIM